MRLHVRSSLRSAKSLVPLVPRPLQLVPHERRRNALTNQGMLDPHVQSGAANETGGATADGGGLSWYTCGPTVYDDAHAGHARTYVSVDIMQRIVERTFGFRVRHVVNVTDVDDKIIARSKQLEKSPIAVARHFEARFWRDMRRLDVRQPLVVRVTEFIPEIVAYVQQIVDRGHAYVTPEGSVYFDSASLDGYGSFLGAVGDMSGTPPEPAFAASDKKDERDFALWKAAKTGEPSWPSPWGAGRPGWHVECSTMSTAVFGACLDVHAGGKDLKFPHHENEIAQCRAHAGLCGSNDEWPRYFLHTGHLHIEGRKMSKSLKNFITIQDMLDRCSSPSTFRMFCLMHRYGDDVTFHDDAMTAADAELGRFTNMAATVDAIVGNRAMSENIQQSPIKTSAWWGDSDWRLWRSLQQCDNAVHAALADDFNTPKAMQLLGNVAKDLHAYVRSTAPIREDLLMYVVAHVFERLEVFGLSFRAPPSASQNREDMLVGALVDLRNNIRRLAVDKNFNAQQLRSALFSISDSLRDEQMPELGVHIRDDEHSGIVSRKP